MGMTVVEVMVKKAHEARKARTVKFLVDSGDRAAPVRKRSALPAPRSNAIYSVVEASILRTLACKPHRRKSFFLADGTAIERRIGDAYFEYGGICGAAPVIFGEKGDRNLLGATTLEALELVRDPPACRGAGRFKRELRPMTMTLMGASPFR